MDIKLSLIEDYSNLQVIEVQTAVDWKDSMVEIDASILLKRFTGTGN